MQTSIYHIITITNLEYLGYAMLNDIYAQNQVLDILPLIAHFMHMTTMNLLNWWYCLAIRCTIYNFQVISGSCCCLLLFEFIVDSYFGLIIILFFKYIKTKKDLEGIKLNDSLHDITIHSDEEDNNNNIDNTNHNNKRASVTINKTIFDLTLFKSNVSVHFFQC